MIPPLSTQTAIVQHIEEKTTKIDSAIGKIEEEMKLMEEYKKSLIYHAVTGKISV